MDPLPINPAQTAFKALLENPGISWKAKRYQVLLEQFSINFQQYLLTTPSLVDSIKKIHSNPEFKTTLIPLINHLLVSRLRHPTDPSNVEYLNFHRKAYYQCLTLLREAVRWAEINRDRTDITAHVFAACRIFYTETRFNFCALIIFGTFKEMGTQALSEKKSSHPPQYEATSGIHLMTKGLEVHHKRIKSVVGTEQTETWLSKIWNSTIGYVILACNLILHKSFVF
jgi:hypothetical protein